MKISELKAHLSEVLKRVQKGARIVITDRDRPVAEVVPFEPPPSRVRVRPGMVPLRLDRMKALQVPDPLTFLLEDRERR